MKKLTMTSALFAAASAFAMADKSPNLDARVATDFTNRADRPMRHPPPSRQNML